MIFSSAPHRNTGAKPRTHEANPILLQHRRDPERPIYWRDMIDQPSEEHKDHAHRVLSKLARVRALDN